MDEKRFDELWEQEQLQALLQRLQDDYPAWRRRRRRRRTAVVSFAVLLAIVLPTIHWYAVGSADNPLPTKHYDGICCNRSGIADAHWAAVAGNILTIETL